MELPSSFWLDETVTAFVARYGANHPSLADAAPQAWRSIYYFVPRAAGALLGFSEVSYRVPSVLAMGVALLLIARLATRLIHPEAGWFAVFACLTLRGINYEAADARPYALGICIAAAGLTFLVRWLDSTGWAAAMGFGLCAALLWRVHLLFWPVYIVFALYALLRHEKVGWMRIVAVFGAVGVALLPVLYDALSLYREAHAHVIMAKPSLRELAGALKLGLVIPVGIGAWLIDRSLWSRLGIGVLSRDQRERSSSLALIAGWWFCQPICLFAFSWLTGNSVFVPRYLALSLPGAALGATAAAALFLPSNYWKPAAAAMALGALLFVGDWRTLWPPHHNSDWRAAAATVNEFDAATPVLCPSPFIEARSPVWRPDYPLPGFLYAHLEIYPVRGKTYLFPFETSPQAEQFAADLSSQSKRIILYGWNQNVRFWSDWFTARGWRARRLGPFGDVEVTVFEKGV